MNLFYCLLIVYHGLSIKSALKGDSVAC